MARDKISIDPLALIGYGLTLISMTAAGTWFLISRFENSENALLKQQTQYLEEQVQVYKQESAEMHDVLRRVKERTHANPAVQKILNDVVKETTGILGERELGINEAVTIPNTAVSIVHENIVRYPLLNSLRVLFPFLSKWIVSLNSLQVRADGASIANNLFPRAGTEMKFEREGIKYRVVILAVRENSIRIGVFAEAVKGKT